MYRMSSAGPNGPSEKSSIVSRFFPGVCEIGTGRNTTTETQRAQRLHREEGL